jgi:hypothetical protein
MMAGRRVRRWMSIMTTPAMLRRKALSKMGGTVSSATLATACELPQKIQAIIIPANAKFARFMQAKLSS